MVSLLGSATNKTNTRSHLVVETILIKTITRIAAAVALAAGVLAFWTPPASARVGITEGERQHGSYTVPTFGVPL